MNLTIVKRAVYAVMGCSLFLLLAAAPAKASGSACPTLSGTGGGGETVDPTYASNAITDGGCNVLITFASNGAISTSNPNPAPYYDSGVDDNMVGIVNNTGSAITQIYLTSSQPIFGFDGDGACSGFMLSFGSCTSGSIDGYGGAGVSFTVVDAFHGYVNFGNGGIAANGGTGWFSLEGPASLTAQGVSNSPEPASLVLLGTGLLGLGLAFRRYSA